MKNLLVVALVALLPACVFSSKEPIEPNADIGVDVPSDPEDAGGGNDLSTPDMGGREDVSLPDLGDCAVQSTEAITVNEALDAASDGRCDCTCTLRDALAAVAEGGSINFEVSGDLDADASLELTTSGVTIDGGNATLSSDLTDAPLMVVDDSATGSTLRGFRLRGGSAALVVGSVGVDVIEMRLEQSNVGVVLRGTSTRIIDSTLDSNIIGALVAPTGGELNISTTTVSNSRLHGVYVAPGQGAVLFRNGEVGGSGGHGIIVRRTNMLVEGSLVAGNALHGILVDVESADAQTTTIRSNQIGAVGAPNRLGGVEIVRAGNIVVGGAGRPTQLCVGACNIIGPNGYGVLVQSAADVAIQGNYIGVGDDLGARPNGAGIIVGLDGGYAVDGEDGGILGAGWVRRGVGGACSHSGDCLADVDLNGDLVDDQFHCVSERFDLQTGALAYPGGMCTAACDPVNNPCAQGICDGTRCYAQCEQASDCRAGYSCADGACRFDPGVVPPAGDPTRPDVRGAVLIGRENLGPDLPSATCNGGCNVIAANLGDAINVVSGSDVTVAGNFIGLGPSVAIEAPNGSDNLKHAGLSIHPPPAVTTAPVIVQGNLFGSNSGYAALIRAQTHMADNWVGLATDGVTPRPGGSGLLLGNGHSGTTVERNLIANIDAIAIQVAQGTQNALLSFNQIGVDAMGGTVMRAYDTGIRVQDAGTSFIDVEDNLIVSPAQTGIAIGANRIGDPALDHLQEIHLNRNTIQRGAANAGIEVLSCEDCSVAATEVIQVDGPGAVLGDQVLPAEFKGTTFTGNLFLEGGFMATSFTPGVVMYNGTGLSFTNNEIESPWGDGVILGVPNRDFNFSGTTFSSNTLSCPFPPFNGSGFLIRNGYGVMIEFNTITDFNNHGIDLEQARTRPTSAGWWGNTIDVNFLAISFDPLGTDAESDGITDQDNGANTLLNPPVLGTVAPGPMGGFTITGTTNLADARIDVYRGDNDIQAYPLFEHLGHCSSRSGNPEPFTCPAMTASLTGDAIRLVASARHVVLNTIADPVPAGTTVTIQSQSGVMIYTTSVQTNAVQFVDELANSMRTSLPDILVSHQTACAAGSPCVHVVTGVADTSFNATSAVLAPAQHRGIVSSLATTDYNEQL